MSLTGKAEASVVIKASALKFHEIVQKRPYHISNVSGDKIQACSLHQGEWGQVGSIISWNYYHDGKAKVAKHLIEAVDEEKNMITLKVLESFLLDYYKSFKYILHATPKGDGSVIHCTIEYEKLNANIPDSHNSMLKIVVGICKDLEAHLMEAN